VVTVCAVTAGCDREPQDAGQRPDRGAGFAGHAFRFCGSTVVSHPPNAGFAALSTGPGVHAPARERVEEELLVSEAG
jgi:hypothetical protein